MWESFVAMMTKILAFRFLVKLVLYLFLFTLLVAFVLWKQGVAVEDMLEVINNFLKNNNSSAIHLEFILKYFK